MTVQAALPSGWAGRVLALALAGALALLVWLAAAEPLLQWHAQRAETLDNKRALLRRMEAVAASLPDWQAAQAGAAAHGPARPALLEGGTDAVAAAALQGILQEMASRAGARVGSMEILATEPRAPYRRIAVRVVVEGQWPVLLELLRAVGDAAPRMLVDGLNLRGPDPRMRTDGPPLAATFTVLAFRAAAATERP